MDVILQNRKLDPKMRIASCGFGVCSTAMLFVSDYDLIIHSNTQMDQEWTRAIQGFTRQYFDSKMIEVTHNVPNSKRGFFIHPKFRRCTERFKLRPMRKHLRSLGLKKITTLIGYTIEEKTRAKQTFQNKRNWENMEFPLIEQELTRYDCIQILKRYFPFRVLKSGCIDCFNKSPSELSMPLTNYLTKPKIGEIL